MRWVDGNGGGLAGAQNIAFGEARMPVVAVIDDDCVADADWIATVERAFASETGLALLGGRVDPLPPAGERTLAVSSRTSAARRRFAGRSAPWNVGSGNNFAVRSEWFERVGGCDERLGPGTPGQGALDMDLFYRVLRAGGAGLYEPEAIVEHERVLTRGSAGAALAVRPRHGRCLRSACARARPLWSLAARGVERPEGSGASFLALEAPLGDPPRGSAGVGRNRNGLCARAFR